MQGLSRHKARSRAEEEEYGSYDVVGYGNPTQGDSSPHRLRAVFTKPLFKCRWSGGSSRCTSSEERCLHQSRSNNVYPKVRGDFLCEDLCVGDQAGLRRAICAEARLDVDRQAG